MVYVPSPEHLRRYADLLSNFALGGGAGIGPGDVVLVSAAEPAKPLYASLCEAVWRAGGHEIADYRPSDDAEHNLTARFFERVIYADGRFTDRLLAPAEGLEAPSGR